MQTYFSLPIFLFFCAFLLAFCSVTILMVWMQARTREREAFYKTEAVKRLADVQMEESHDALEYMREENARIHLASQEASRLGGLIAVAGGLGLTIFLFALSHRSGYGVIATAGIIPILIGIALLLHSRFMAKL